MDTYGPTQTNNLADELSLLDIIEFIQENWKTIAGFTLLGIAGATLYLWMVPNQYEASAQIRMAQVINTNVNNTTALVGTNIEDPQALIARMALPTSYPKETIEICGLANQKLADTLLAKKVKFSIPKGVAATVNLEIRDVSKDTAKACVDAVFKLIKSSQNQLIAPYIESAQKKIAIDGERLSRATQMIAKADMSGVAVSAVYLSTRDEIRYLLDQISSLQDFITNSESSAAYLVAPIYLKDWPVFPQKGNTLLIGILFGGFLGVVLALACKWYRSKYAV